MKKFPESREDTAPAALPRRLAAMLYDTLICAALLIVTTGVYKMVQARVMGSERLKALTEAGALDHDPLLSSILFVTMYLFFAYFWTKSGQTLGMQVWHIRIQTPDGYTIRWMQALLRFMMAWVSAGCAGLGYLWMLWDKDHKTWHDHFSMTEVVRIPKRTGEK